MYAKATKNGDRSGVGETYCELEMIIIEAGREEPGGQVMMHK